MAGYVSRRAEEQERRLKARSEDERRLNDELMSIGAFRRLLDRLADRYGYMGVAGPVDDYQRGANDAVRHILNQFATNSDGGAEWISAYVKSRAGDVESEK